MQNHILCKTDHLLKVPKRAQKLNVDWSNNDEIN